MHKSVMINEVIEWLNLKPGAKIIDATLDGGGHTKAILERFNDLKVLGVEFDPVLFENCKLEIENLSQNIILVNDSYVNLKNIADEHDFYPDGVIFDLGVSSWHYEKSGRGFSFMKDEPLDMRFHPDIDTKTAADLLNTCSKERLEDILVNYGEEKFASEIVKRIIEARRIKPIVRTTVLVGIINNSVPGWYRRRKINPATKTFQALRLAVNNELDNVAKGVNAAINITKSGGRIIVISFHGLEDKIVREIFKTKTKDGIIKWAIKGTVKPKWEEVRQNPRARSAKMKVVEKL